MTSNDIWMLIFFYWSFNFEIRYKFDIRYPIVELLKKIVSSSSSISGYLRSVKKHMKAMDSSEAQMFARCTKVMRISRNNENQFDRNVDAPANRIYKAHLRIGWARVSGVWEFRNFDSNSKLYVIVVRYMFASDVCHGCENLHGISENLIHFQIRNSTPRRQWSIITCISDIINKCI